MFRPSLGEESILFDRVLKPVEGPSFAVHSVDLSLLDGQQGELLFLIEESQTGLDHRGTVRAGWLDPLLISSTPERQAR